MDRRVAVALGFARAQRWIGTLVDEVLAVYAAAPGDRPRELALFVQPTQGWERMGGLPRVAHRRPRATTVARDRFGVPPLADAAALARLLDLDHGELAWFGDVRGLERTVGEPLRHYRWHTVERRGAARRGAAAGRAEARLKEVQRRCCGHVPARVPVHDAAQGCVLGRVAWAGSLDPLFGERLHALAARIDWA